MEKKQENQMADAIHALAREVRFLGTGGVRKNDGSELGAIEGLASLIYDSNKKIADSISDVADAIRELAQTIEDARKTKS